MATADRLVLAPALPSLEALGVRDADALFAGVLERAELLGDARGERRLRVALPGTPGPDGRLSGAPAGAGTGWVVVQSWREPKLGELFAARFTAPRSVSLAEREWNLLCHLRAQGVGTPEPLAVGSRGRGVARRSSFLVTRELRGFVPLASFAAAPRSRDEEQRFTRAAATFLARLLRARYVCPHLGSEAVRVRAELPEHDGGQARRPHPEHACEDAALGTRRNRLPGFALAEVCGGRITKRFEPRAVARMLAGLARELASAGLWPGLYGPILRAALRAGLSCRDRRALFAELRRARA